MNNENKCLSCEAFIQPLSHDQIKKRVSELDAWTYDERYNCLSKIFSFKNFYRVMSFVNMVAWIANNQNHHSEMIISYDKCEIKFWTHAVSGITENDFICAKKIDALLRA